MNALVECPHCATRVLPMAGRICPACRNEIDAEPTARAVPEQFAEGVVYRFAADEMRRGIAPEKVKASLTEIGVNPNAAASLVDDIEQSRARIRQAAAKRNMAIGAAWCFGGVVVSVLTFQAAANAGGGTYLIAWGAILFGGFQFIRGLMLLGAE
jgi:hypothetical protein